MLRPLVMTGVLLFAVATTPSVDGSQKEGYSGQDERDCCQQPSKDACKKGRRWDHGEQVINIDQVVKEKSEEQPKEKSREEFGHGAVHMSISMQDSVLFVSTRPFAVVRFVPAYPKTYPKPRGLKNPFLRKFPAKATEGWDHRYRVSTGPARRDQPREVLKHLENEWCGISYNSILTDENGKPIDPHIEILK